MYKILLATLTATALSIGPDAAAPAISKEPLDAATLVTIKSKFGMLMKLANNHDFKTLHDMFWQSPSTIGGEKRNPVRGKLGRLLGQRGN
jgi:hypothetical protein